MEKETPLPPGSAPRKVTAVEGTAPDAPLPLDTASPDQPSPIGSPSDPVEVESKSAAAVGVDREQLHAYWAKNVKLTSIILLIWFVVSYGAALVVGPLNNITILGFPLGYYMGAQGSLIVFVILIAVYAARMNKYDREFDLHEIHHTEDQQP